MELPSLGDHCALPTCSRLDFLPVKCTGCRGLFCTEHFAYDSHSCPTKPTKDARVPVCPLCNLPIPLRKKGDLPDLLVSQHIDSDCQSDPAKDRRKVFDQRCAVKKCKKKEMIKIKCDVCQMNFCLQHRHPQDHACAGAASVSSKASDAAALRQRQAQMAADEAMARRLQASMTSSAAAAQSSVKMSQEELDRMMALSLAAEMEGGRTGTTTAPPQEQPNKSCNVS